MEPIFLKGVEQAAKSGPAGTEFAAMEAQGTPVPQILLLTVGPCRGHIKVTT